MAPLHPSGGIAEDWGECIPSDINAPLHSLNLSCYRRSSWSASVKTTIRDQGIYPSALITRPFRSHTIVTIQSLSSSDINPSLWTLPAFEQSGSQAKHPVAPGLWALIALLPTGLWTLAALGDRSVDPPQHLKDLHMLSNNIRSLHIRHHCLYDLACQSLTASPSDSSMLPRCCKAVLASDVSPAALEKCFSVLSLGFHLLDDADECVHSSPLPD